MVTPEKIQELRAVVDFWKFRVDESKRHLQNLLARQTALTVADRCGQSFMATLVEMKSRELAESQRGLRRAQANLGRELESAGEADTATTSATTPARAAARAPAPVAGRIPNAPQPSNRLPQLSILREIPAELSPLSLADLRSMVARHRPSA